MRLARLWISVRNEYLDIQLPDSCAVYKNDMGVEVECPWCGKKLPFGECYTSKVFHTPVTGFGYAICPDCDEWDLRFYAGKDGRLR